MALDSVSFREFAAERFTRSSRLKNQTCRALQGLSNGIHQVYLGETALAVLADEIGSRCHPAPVGGTPVLGVVGHHSEHFQSIVLSFFFNSN